jgi:hypothetical protein
MRYVPLAGLFLLSVGSWIVVGASRDSWQLSLRSAKIENDAKSMRTCKRPID